MTIGHKVMLHSCTIKTGALVGMGAIVLDGAEVGEGAFIGAGSLVTPGTKIPPNTLALGSPARVVRDLNDADRTDMEVNSIKRCKKTNNQSIRHVRVLILVTHEFFLTYLEILHKYFHRQYT